MPDLAGLFASLAGEDVPEPPADPLERIASSLGLTSQELREVASQSERRNHLEPGSIEKYLGTL